MTKAEVTFPNDSEVTNLIPEGRRPYAIVRQTLGHDQQFSDHAIIKALGIVAEAHEDGTLESPLSEKLGDVVVRASHFIRPEDAVNPGFDIKSAEDILEAVFEHGYRSDLASG